MSKLLLYTGYFAKENEYRNANLLPVSIARFTPKWFKGDSVNNLAPTGDLLNRFKNKEISEEDYEKEYRRYLDSDIATSAFKTNLSKDIAKKAMAEGYDGIALLCFEKVGDFCHRHILADYLHEKYNIHVSEFDISKTKEVTPALEPTPEIIEDKISAPIMYGSTHTHFESLYDSANDLHDMLDEFVKAGAKRVAVTEHGDFTSFEELKDIVDKYMKDEDKNRKIDVIPGVEGYFNTTKPDETLSDGSSDRDHMILIAKDRIGYQYLSNIITRANIDHDSKDRAIITWDNLRDNIKEQGHLYCTTACIAGPMGRIFEDKDKERKRQIDKYLKRIPFTEDERKEIVRLNDEYQNMSDSQKKALSAEEKENYKENRKKYNVIKRNVDKATEINEAFGVVSENDTEKRFEEAQNLYNSLTDIFGKEMVYLEIQNHGIDKEQEVYPGIIDFAIKNNVEDKLIASNDIHIGKIAPTETDFLRRNVAKFQRFNTYEPDEAWERELYIKSDKTLKEWLMKLPIENIDSLKSLSADEQKSRKEQLIDTAIKNIEGLLSPCEVDYIYKKDKDHYPKFCEDENSLFDSLVDKGIPLKFPEGFPSEAYKERLEYEKNIIKSMGYAGYHLIVQDYLNYGRLLGKLPDKLIPFAPLNLDELKKLVSEFEDIEDRVKSGAGFNLDDHPIAKVLIDGRMTAHELSGDILSNKYSTKSINIGPGRGSGVGSLCCYLLGITDIDPIPYGLLFERFLNPERVSMPDIDADFRTDIREKCIQYCAKKYGTEKTCKIITKSYGDIKGNFRLAARYIGNRDFEKEVSLKERAVNKTDIHTDFMKRYLNIGDSLAKMVDDKTGEFPEDKAAGLRGSNREVYELALKISGLYTGFGEHAAGNIISMDNISDIIPLKWNAKNKNYSTQCTMADAEAKGLLKMDFLGLDNLDILTEMIRLTGDDIINDYSKRNELLKDEHIMEEIFDTGLTHGVFQFESDGMKNMLKDFKPDSFEDIILLVAAYRPGPIQYLPEIILRKKYQRDSIHNAPPERTIKVNSPILDEILKPTYGCPIYQEQVMKICTDLAGYSMGQADIVRKYMSKKKEEPLKAERQAFIYGDESRGILGCIKKAGISEGEANGLFDQMLDFAKYAFNKSHATAYALIAFFTAYYKDRYPALFYSVSLNHMKALTELAPFRSEMSAFNVKLCPPEIGKSKNGFSVDGNNVYFGISNINGIPEMNINMSDNLKELMLINPGITKKRWLNLANAKVLAGFGDKASVSKYIEDYHDNILKKEETEEKLKDLQAAETPDKRKISGAIRTLEKIGEIPDYVRPEKEFVDIKEDIVEQYKMLGTVFFDNDMILTMSRSPAFNELPNTKNKTITEKCRFFCLGSDPKEYKSKFNNSSYFAVNLMDKNYDIRKYFMPFRLSPGLYEGNMNQNPFSTNVRDKDFGSAVREISGNEDMSACIKNTTNLKRQGQLTRLAKIKERNGDRNRYCPIYTGNKNSKVELGKLDREEFIEFITDEKKNHNTEFIYGDEFVNQ